MRALVLFLILALTGWLIVARAAYGAEIAHHCPTGQVESEGTTIPVTPVDQPVMGSAAGDGTSRVPLSPVRR